MEKNIAFDDVLATFARYGFRKASMEDLAQAAGVSRQTLYNRFRTKQAVLDWAVTGFVEARTQRAHGHLKLPGQPLGERLLRFYVEWMGLLVPLLHDSPHGSEIMEMGGESLENAGIDSHDDNERVIADFLIEHGLRPDPATATETSFLLSMSSKGLLFKCATTGEFEAGMRRVIRAVLPDL